MDRKYHAMKRLNDKGGTKDLQNKQRARRIHM